MSQQVINQFYTECVRSNTWSAECSTLTQTYADQPWLQQAIADIFVTEVPARDLSNPVVNKLVAMTPDCLLTPQACQAGLNWACLNSTAEVNNKYGFNRGAASRLCGCFSAAAKRYGWQTNCYCNSGSSGASLAVANLSQPLCLANICEVDNVSVLLNNSSTAGDINIQQACGGYNLNTRLNCTINGINVFVDNSSIGSLLLQQQCLSVANDSGEAGNANNITAGGSSTVVNHSGVTTTTDNVSSSQPWLITAFVLILAIFIVLCIVVVILYTKSLPSYRLVITNSNGGLLSESNSGSGMIRSTTS